VTAEGRKKIGIDCSELEGKPTGVGRYLLNLLRHWGEDAPQHEYICYFMEELPDAPFLFQPPFSLKLIYPVPLRSRLVWEQWQLRKEAEADEIDLFFSPGYSLPLGMRPPCAMTVHDLSFEAHPAWFTLADGLKRRFLCRRGTAKADLIFTDSNFSRKELLSHYQPSEVKIRVIPIGAEPAYFQRRPEPACAALKEAHGLKGRLVLSVGSIFNRRCLPELLRGFGLFRRKHPDTTLIIIGENRTYPRTDFSRIIEELDLAGRVRFFDFAPEETLLQFYSAADIFIYLSRYEGFGLPPLEAMCFGLPVIVSGDGALGEIYRDAAYLLNDITPTEIASALAALAENPSLRDGLRRKGRALTEKYTWRETARRTLSHLLQLVG
jgi:glycosyltransferase involved in cell wall biosynthesis